MAWQSTDVAAVRLDASANMPASGLARFQLKVKSD
jgi:hypothetical protein